MTDELDTAPLWFGDFERRINARFDAIEAQLASIETRLSALETGFARLEAGVSELHEINEALDEKIDIFVKEVLDIKRRLRKDAA